MVAMNIAHHGNELLVITRDGNIFGADVGVGDEGGSMGNVFLLSTATIGFNPQDKFMMGIPLFGSDLLGNPTSALVVVTQDETFLGLRSWEETYRPKSLSMLVQYFSLTGLR
jgi:hypothetical protein